jgi:hypothetical protein
VEAELGGQVIDEAVAEEQAAGEADWEGEAVGVDEGMRIVEVQPFAEETFEPGSVAFPVDGFRPQPERGQEKAIADDLVHADAAAPAAGVGRDGLDAVPGGVEETLAADAAERVLPAVDQN